MSGETIGVLAAGVLVGVSIVYANNNDYKLDVVLDKISSNQKNFKNILDNLISFGREVLEKLLNYLLKMINKIGFEAQLLFSKFALNIEE